MLSIENIFQYIVRIEKYLEHTVNPNCVNCSKTQEEKEDQLVKTLIEYKNYYDKNELYFPTETANKINLMNEKFSEVWDDWKEKKKIEQTSYDIALQIQNWRNILDKVKDDIPTIKNEIKTEFRELIGVE